MKNGILNAIVQFREGSCTLGSFAGYRGHWQDIPNHIHSVEDTATVSIHHRTPWVRVCWRLLREYPFLSLASPAVRTGSPSHLLQEIHIHEKVPSGGGRLDSRMAAGKSFFWVTALHGSWHADMSGNWCSDWRHLSHLNIPERVASQLKLVSFLSSYSKRAWQPLTRGGSGEKREKEKKMVRTCSKWVMYKVNTEFNIQDEDTYVLDPRYIAQNWWRNGQEER